MNKIVKIILIVIGVLAAVLWFMLPDSEMPVADAANDTALNAMFILAFVLLGIAVVVSLGFSLVNVFSNPATLKKALFVLVGFALVCGIAFVLADGTDIDISAMADRGIETDESTVKRIGAGINVFFMLVAIAVGAMLWGGVRKATK